MHGGVVAIPWQQQSFISSDRVKLSMAQTSVIRKMFVLSVKNLVALPRYVAREVGWWGFPWWQGWRAAQNMTGDLW